MSTRYDLVGVGIGPFNLSLAALAEPSGLRTLFLDDKPWFAWHPGMMVDGARLQVPFLADLVSLTDPTSRFSALNWLRETERLYSFYFEENLFLERREYEAYCQWVAEQLPSCRFGARVTRVRRLPGVGGAAGPGGVGDPGDAAELRDPRDPRELGDFEIEIEGGERVRAANLVLGIGTEPVVPESVRHLLGDGALHSADYLTCAENLRQTADVTVVGSGQSGAEIVLDLLRTGTPGQRVRWLTRSAAFEPMEYSKLGLEHFTPDYTRYFHSLPADVRAALLRVQGRLHKAVSAETLADLHAEFHAGAQATVMPGVEVTGGSADGGELVLGCLHDRLKTEFTVHTGAVVFATGYRERRPAFLDGVTLGDADLDHRVAPNLYVQNAERRTHGVGAPDLGLGAHRAATILNAVAGRIVHRLPARAAHTTFDPAVAADRDPGIRLAAPHPVPHPRPEEPSDADPLPHRPR